MSVTGPMALKDVKNRLSEVVDQVEREHDRVIITKHGRPAAVVVSLDDLESLEETLAILSNPSLLAAVREGLADEASGRVSTIAKDDLLAQIRA